MTDIEKIEYVNYEMFGAKGDGVTDDSEAIKAAHDYANENKIDVKTNPSATYYIGCHPFTAIIKTNVDFGASKFIVDDSTLTPAERGAPLFRVVSDYEPIPLEITSLKKNQMKLDVELPMNCYVKVDNANKKQFIRFGLNQNNGSSQTDCFVVDKSGYILNKVIWNFETVTSVEARPIDETVRIIRGGIFTSVANQAESKYTYYGRHMIINRSNTIVENITHHVVGELDHGAPYSGFITVEKCAYVTIRNCHLTPRKIYQTIGSAGKPVSMGSYAMLGSSAVDVHFENIKQNGIMDRTRWGLMATNHCKDLYVEGCIMSRFDAHENVANLTVRNCILGHQCFNAIGHGIMTVENVTAYGNSFLNLRGDYGSTWDGDIVFKNNTWYPNKYNVSPTFIGGVNAGDHDFGFPCYMPHRITVDGLLICDGDSEDGYEGSALFDTRERVMNGSGVVDFNDINTAHPYMFTEQVSLKNIRTESGKGFAIFNNDIKTAFGIKKHKTDNGAVKPNFRCVLEDVELPDKSLIPMTSLTDADYGETHHIVPKLEFINCDGVKVDTNVPNIVKITD